MQRHNKTVKTRLFLSKHLQNRKISSILQNKYQALGKLISSKLSLFLTTTLLLCSLCTSSQAKVKINLYFGIAYPHFNYSNITIAGSSSQLFDEIEDASVSPGIGLGYSHLFTGSLAKVLHDATIGLDYFYFSSTDTGKLYPNSNPALYNADYKMKIHASRIMLNTEIGINLPISGLIPYLQASMGFAPMNAAYSQTALSGSTGLSFIMPKRNQTNFVYSLGVGTDATISKYVHLTVGYLYTNFGQVDLGTTTSIGPITAPMNIKVYNNTALFGLVILV